METPNGCCHPPADHAAHDRHTAEWIEAARKWGRAEQTVSAIRRLATEYRAACNPAPYTSERALIERLEALLEEA